jgi:predicted trehalose synthase
MGDIFSGYGVRELDDLRTAVDVVHRAVDASAQDQHAGAGTLGDAVERIHLHLADAIGEERAIKGLAALVYCLTIEPSTTLGSWKHSAADRLVDLLKEEGRLEGG